MRNALKISTVALLAAMLAASPSFSASINIGAPGDGGLVTVTGTDTTSPSANVLPGTTAAPPASATTNLLNNGGGPTTASANLGGTGGTSPANANVLLDLFGNGDGGDAVATVGTGATGGDGSTVLLDLFGNGGGAGGTGGAGGNGAGGSGSGSNGGGSTLNNLFGNGSGAAGGSSGNIGRRVASVDTTTDDNCFTPNAAQMHKLTSRHTYSNATFSSWASATGLKIVDVGLCNRAGVDIAADANVARLQSFVNGNAALKAGLGNAGHTPGDVIAADKSGRTLVVYVM